MRRLAQFVVGMGMCIIGLRSRRLEDPKGGGWIEDADCGIIVFYFVLVAVKRPL